jgi:acetyltransferase-like isoleucine patch superfamily enzyme
MTDQRTWRSVRFVWAVLSVVLLETVLLGGAIAPALAFVQWQARWPINDGLRVLLLSLAVVPLYLLFAALLVVMSALATRVLGWRTPAGITARLADFEWPVLTWGRYLMTIHVVRVFAGPAFRSSPIWSWYLRLNGARVGRLVWVNSLSVMDHNLLEFGDNVVVGADVHLSGHSVERGLLKTAPVRLGAGTVIGVGSVVGVGVTTGPETQVGALSVVPKFSALEGHKSYGGVPVQRLH